MPTKREVILSQIKKAKHERLQHAGQMEFLDHFIAKLESELGDAASGPLVKTKSERRQKPRRKLWDFTGKSRPEAVKVILNRYRRPMKTPELLNVLLKAGTEISGNSKKQQNANLFNTLKQATIIEKLNGGYWALPEWSKERKELSKKEPA